MPKWRACQSANIKNATEETTVISYDTGLTAWTVEMVWKNNAGNPGLAVESNDNLLMSYIRPGKPWLTVYDVVTDTAIITIKSLDSTINGDTNMAIDANGSIFVASDSSGWLYDGSSEIVLPMADAPYRLASDPSGSEDLYILGTSGLTLYAMK